MFSHSPHPEFVHTFRRLETMPPPPVSAILSLISIRWEADSKISTGVRSGCLFKWLTFIKPWGRGTVVLVSLGRSGQMKSSAHGWLFWAMAYPPEPFPHKQLLLQFQSSVLSYFGSNLSLMRRNRSWSEHDTTLKSINSNRAHLVCSFFPHCLLKSACVNFRTHKCALQKIGSW